MPAAFGSTAYWREYADEARATARIMQDPDARSAMVTVAESYEEMAKRAEGREAGVLPRGPSSDW